MIDEENHSPHHHNGRHAIRHGHTDRVWALVSAYGPDVTRLCQAGPTLLPGVTGLGLSAGALPTPETRFSSDAAGARMEALQQNLGEGPCRDVSASRAPLAAANLTAASWATQWPRFTPGVLAAGVRSLYALPLHGGGVQHHGAIDLYRPVPGRWDNVEQPAAAFAAAVTELLTLERLNVDLTAAFTQARLSGGSDAGRRPPTAEPGRAGDALLVSWFDRRTITALRHQVGTLSAVHGLHGAGLHRFVLAVHEAITNAVNHGGGNGQLLLWRTSDQLCCEISDHGPGIPAGAVPVGDRLGLHGLSVIRRAYPDAEITTDTTGARLRLSHDLTP